MDCCRSSIFSLCTGSCLRTASHWPRASSICRSACRAMPKLRLKLNWVVVCTYFHLPVDHHIPVNVADSFSMRCRARRQPQCSVSSSAYSRGVSQSPLSSPRVVCPVYAPGVCVDSMWPPQLALRRHRSGASPPDALLGSAAHKPQYRGNGRGCSPGDDVDVTHRALTTYTLGLEWHHLNRESLDLLLLLLTGYLCHRICAKYAMPSFGASCRVARGGALSTVEPV